MDGADTPIRVKVCGLTRQEDVTTCVEAGVAYLGFVFFSRSPRNVTPAAASRLLASVPPGVATVGLFVDPGDDDLERTMEVAPVDIVQLHGDEDPDRLSEIRALVGRPVMKALGVATVDDLARLDLYESVADMVLVDARPPRGAARPGGHGVPFDWRILQGRRWARPWMLAGGLGADNVGEAVRLTGATQLDVSSGVEAAPGIKSAERLSGLLAAAGQARATAP